MIVHPFAELLYGVAGALPQDLATCHPHARVFEAWNDVRQPVRSGRAIRINEGDDRETGGAQAGIARLRTSASGFPDHADAIRVTRKNRRGAIGRGVIDDDDLEAFLGVIEREQRANGFRDGVLRVVRRDYYGNGWLHAGVSIVVTASRTSLASERKRAKASWRAALGARLATSLIPSSTCAASGNSRRHCALISPQSAVTQPFSTRSRMPMRRFNPHPNSAT